MSQFSPDKGANGSSSEPNGSPASGFSPDSEPSPDTIAANTMGLPATSPNRPEPAATPGVILSLIHI